MTATDELRCLLDERGIEWVDFGRHTYWPDDSILTCDATEEGDGQLCLTFYPTPQQAVDATLGRGTCEMEYVPDWMGWHCKSCDDLRQGLREQKPRYCPNCGLRVVDA